ncbi:MAG: class I SAM-dependent methyltransferase family protein [Promethearchaeota archaeon]|nr:MAG: class I SAM-dependent methyltransferase family protein [Candidatus Lokiarchaeota archaeon]
MDEDLTYFLRILKADAQEIMNLINSHFPEEHLLNHKKKIVHEQDYVLFPLTEDDIVRTKFTQLMDPEIKYEIITRKAEENPHYKPNTLFEALEGKIPKELNHLIPRSYDIIGSIAIIEFDKEETLYNQDLFPIKKIISLAIMEINRNVKSVYEKTSEVKGTFRLRELTLLAGIDKAITIHKENNCSFELDVKEVYFTPRLVFERKRISSLEYKENEVIIDLFAGVGPFSIQIANRHKVEIYAFDINEMAVAYLKKNIEQNDLIGTIYPFELNIADLLKSNNEIGQKLENNADRIIMNLPERSLKFLKVALFLLNPNGGILHLYQFCEKPNPTERGIQNLQKELAKYNWRIDELMTSKIVKAFSPKADLVVLDIKIKSIKKI